MRPILVSLLFALALPAPVAAAPVLKLSCTSLGRPLPKKGKVPGGLDCVLSARKLKGHSGVLKANLRASWNGSGGPSTTAEKAAARDQVSFRFQLEEGIAFPECEKFELLAEVSSARGPVGKARLAVSQDCPRAKVKAGRAALSCRSPSPDGTRYDYPGNGEKARPRLVRELNCAILLDQAPASGGAVKGTLRVGKRSRTAEVREVSGGVEAAATFFPGDDFPSCDGFTAEGELTIDGQPLWKGSIPIPQSCAP